MAAPKRLGWPLGRWGDHRRINTTESPTIAACWRRRLRRCARIGGIASECGSRDWRSTPRALSEPRLTASRQARSPAGAAAATRRLRGDPLASLRRDRSESRRGRLRRDPCARRRRRTQGDARPLRRVTAGTDFATDEFAARRAWQSRRARRARCRRLPHEAGCVPRLRPGTGPLGPSWGASKGPGSPGGREGGSNSKLAKSAAKKMSHAARLANVGSNGPTGLFRTRRSRPGRRPGWRAFEASSGLFVPLTHGPGQYARRPGTRAESVPLGTRAGSAWNLAGSASPRLGPTVPAVT